MSNRNTPPERLKKLYALVGNCVVVPIPYGEKGPSGPEASGWQTVTFEQSLEPDYQNRIYECFRCGGNLGLLLGPASANLVDIDIDADDLVERFLEANPGLRETLRRRGKRGCGLMLRMEGDYPIGKWDLKMTDGAKFGEWRAGRGHQSVVFGRHPDPDKDGNPIDYQILVAKGPVKTRFEEILWPDWVKRPLPWERAALPPPQAAAGSPNGQHDAGNLDKRIRAWLATIPVAVEGQRGSDPTFHVACTLIQGWALSRDEARPYLQAYSTICKPPWSDKELEHKLADAVKAPLTRPYGFLRNSEVPKKRTAQERSREIGDDWEESEGVYHEIDLDNYTDSEDDEPVPEFPLDALPDMLRKPVEELTRHYRMPGLLPATCALAMNSAALGRGVFTRSNVRKTYANLYAIIGADSGTGKGVVFDELVAPLASCSGRQWSNLMLNKNHAPRLI